MAFTQMTENVEIHQTQPRLIKKGANYSETQAIFDEAAVLLQDFINETLLPELESTADGASAADKIGSSVIEDVVGTTVHSQIANLKLQLNEAVVGGIPEGALDQAVEDAVDALDYARFTNSSGTFSLGGTTCVITDAFITANTQVIISPDPTKELVGTWSVVSTAGSFTITSTETEAENIDFDWGATK
jgi:hypothetical protein